MFIPPHPFCNQSCAIYTYVHFEVIRKGKNKTNKERYQINLKIKFDGGGDELPINMSVNMNINTIFLNYSKSAEQANTVFKAYFINSNAVGKNKYCTVYKFWSMKVKGKTKYKFLNLNMTIS